VSDWSAREDRDVSIVVTLSDATKRLRQRAVRHMRSLEAELRAILERAAQEAVAPYDMACFPGSSAWRDPASTLTPPSRRAACRTRP
jgi:hypothetical protein